MGQFMSGNLVSKGLDLLSAANYGAAGAVDAGLEGQNPLEGAWEGIKNRTTFSDVMETRGVSPWIAKPAGLLADIAVPVVPGLGLVRAAMRSEKIAARMAEALTKVKGSSLHDVIRGATGAGDAVRDGAVAATRDAAEGFGISEAARTAFHTQSTPALGHEAARVAAARHGSGAGTSRIAEDALSVDRAQGPPGASTAPLWLEGVTALKNKLFKTYSSYMADHPQLGTIGKAFSEKGRQQLLIETRLKAKLKGDYDEILKGLSRKDWPAFFDNIHGIADAPNARWGGVISKHRSLSHEMFDVLSKAGVQEDNGALTVLFRQGRTNQPAVLEALGKLNDVAENPEALNSMRRTFKGEGTWHERLAALIHETGGTIKGSRVRMPIKEADNYAALMLTPLGRSHKIQQNLDEIRAVIMREDPSIGMTAATEAAMQFIKENADDLSGLRKSLQFQRGGRVVKATENKGHYVLNPKQYLYKQIDDFASRAAQATVWGGQDELYHGLRSRAAATLGASLTDPDAIPKAGAAGALETMDRGFRILTGTYRNPEDKVVQMVSRLADILYLGPRTIAIQASNLPNIGALSGIGNSFASITQALTDPVGRALAERLGVTLPSLYHAVDTNLVPKLLKDWNPITRGVGAADRSMRVAAALSGGAHLLQLEEGLKEAISVGSAIKVKKLARQFKRYDFGDAEIAKILEQGGQLSTDQLMRGMVQSANITQFTGNVMDLSAGFQSPVGRFLGKFKQFSFQQSHFINRLIKLAEAGDAAPLLRYAAMLPWVYGPIFKTINSMKANPVDTEDQKAVLQSLLQLGALGFVGDAAMALSSDSEALQIGMVAGANTGALSKVARGGWKAAHGDLTEAVHDITPAMYTQAKNLVTPQ